MNMGPYLCSPGHPGIEQAPTEDQLEATRASSNALVKTGASETAGPPTGGEKAGKRTEYQGGYLLETGILLLELSHNVGDPDVIDLVTLSEAGFVLNHH